MDETPTTLSEKKIAVKSISYMKRVKNIMKYQLNTNVSKKKVEYCNFLNLYGRATFFGMSRF